MRIVAGTFRGRGLQVLEGKQTTRPTPDRVREALFSILQSRVRGAQVLDLFAGSGALGLEALSRGAERATFCESDAAAARVVQANIQALGLQACAQLLAMDAQSALPYLAEQGSLFDLVFIDPPYAAGLYAPIMEQLGNLPLLSAGACAVLESDERHRPGELIGWTVTDRRKYGAVHLSFYQKECSR